MARKKKVPTPVADEPSVVPPTEDTELAELAGEPADSTPGPSADDPDDADGAAPADSEPTDSEPADDAEPHSPAEDPAQEPAPEPEPENSTDEAANEEAEAANEGLTEDGDNTLTPEDEAIRDEAITAELDHLDNAPNDADEPAKDDEARAEGAEPTGDELTDDGDDDLTPEDEAIRDEAVAEELDRLDDVPDDADDPMADPQAPFDDDLDLPWMDAEEAALTESTSSAFKPLPVSPASPADTTYPPPPPYDPTALRKTRRRKGTEADNATSPPSGADYMLADAMGGGPKKVRRTPLLIGAAVLVLALIGGIIWAAPTLFPSLFGPPRNATPRAAVETYLNALASADAATAIKAAVTPPAETALLTNEMLAASQKRAPITNVVVKDASGSTSAVVPVTYQLGGKAVTASFPTQKVGNEWRLVTITRDVQLTGIDGVSVTLNGLPVTDTAHLTLFPGSYLLASANDRLSLTGGEFLVQSPSDFANPTLSATISDKGMANARTAAQSFLNACVKKKELAPAGCGFGVSSAGVKVKSVSWRITSGAKALKIADFRTESSQPYIATVSPYIQLEATVFDKAGRKYTGTAVITVVKADLSGQDVVVTFNR